jgi:hypothetical protein
VDVALPPLVPTVGVGEIAFWSADEEGVGDTDGEELVLAGAFLAVVFFGVGRGRGLGPQDGVGIALGVAFGLLLGVAVGVTVGVAVGVAEGVAVAVAVGVPVAVITGVAVGVTVGEAVIVEASAGLSVSAVADGAHVAPDFGCLPGELPGLGEFPFPELAPETGVPLPAGLPPPVPKTLLKDEETAVLNGGTVNPAVTTNATAAAASAGRSHAPKPGPSSRALLRPRVPPCPRAAPPLRPPGVYAPHSGTPSIRSNRT